MKEKNLQAWQWDDEDSGYSKIIYAENKNQAKKEISLEEDIEYIDVKVYRQKWADQYQDFEKIPKEILLEQGWWLECPDCERKIYEPEDLYTDKQGLEYCCKDCSNKAKYQNFSNKIKGEKPND